MCGISGASEPLPGAVDNHRYMMLQGIYLGSVGGGLRSEGIGMGTTIDLRSPK